MRLWWAAAVVAWVVVTLVVLRTALTFGRAGELADARLAEWPSRAFADARTPVLTAIAMGLLVAAVVLGVAAAFLPRGARWARVTAMLLAVLIAAGSEVLAWMPTTGALLAIDVVVLLACIAVVMLLNPRQVRRRLGVEP